MKLLQYLSTRQRLLLVVLAVLILLMLLLKGVLSDNHDTPQLTPPPLPQVTVLPEALPKTDVQPTTLGSDLRLADKRPVLASPGLTFVTPEAPAPLVTSGAGADKNAVDIGAVGVVAPSDNPSPVGAAAKPITQQPPATATAAREAAAKKAAQRKAAAREAAANKAAQRKAAQRKAAARKAAAREAAAKKAAQRKASEEKSVAAKAGHQPARKATTTTNSTKFAALPADAWLLQVAAAPNAKLATRHCQSLALPCVGYAASRNGRRVWILVVGPFSSRAEALAAVQQLPQKLQAQGPFPRSVESVRADIDN